MNVWRVGGSLFFIDHLGVLSFFFPAPFLGGLAGAFALTGGGGVFAGCFGVFAGGGGLFTGRFGVFAGGGGVFAGRFGVFAEC